VKRGQTERLSPMHLQIPLRRMPRATPANSRLLAVACPRVAKVGRVTKTRHQTRRVKGCLARRIHLAVRPGGMGVSVPVVVMRGRPR
jgi:hypothetical protein